MYTVVYILHRKFQPHWTESNVALLTLRVVWLIQNDKQAFLATYNLLQADCQNQ